MKLKDTDYLYATMRVRANEKTLLTASQIERMVEAKTPEEAAKVLADAGYPDVSSNSFSDIERAIARVRKDAFDLVADACDNTCIREVFALKYDFHNIKTIIKAELTNQAPERIMSDFSVIPKEKLLSAYRAGDLSDIPEKMAKAFCDAKETLSHTGDAQLCDFVLDVACFEMMSDAAKASGSDFLVGYVALLCDIANLRSAVRVSRQKRSADILMQSLVPGGNIAREVFLSFDFESGFARTALSDAAAYGAEAATGKRGMLEFERELDNALIKYMQSVKYVAFDERPIIAYLAAKEAEAMTVRIIMAGKFEGLASDEIRNRLRVL